MIYSTNMNKLQTRGYVENWRNEYGKGVSLEVKKRIIQKGYTTIDMTMLEDGVHALVKFLQQFSWIITHFEYHLILLEYEGL